MTIRNVNFQFLMVVMMIKYLIKKLVLVLIIAFTFLSVNVVFSKEIVKDERPDISWKD